MSERVEGTLILDGLIEGKLPDLPDARRILRDWVAAAGSLKLHFHLEIDGDRFNLLADSDPIAVDELGPEPAEVIRGALADLLKVFPSPRTAGVLSTLRSVEYDRGQEVQTLYAVGAGGKVETHERVVEAETTRPEAPMTRRQKLRLAAIGVGVALLVLLVSSLFVDYRGIISSLFEQITAVDAEKLRIETGGFEKYFAIEKREVKGGRERRLLLTVKRTDAFPRTAADCEKLLETEGKTLAGRLTVEALARGYLRYEHFDKEGEFIGAGEARIADLRGREAIDLVLYLPPKRHPARVVITY